MDFTNIMAKLEMVEHTAEDLAQLRREIEALQLMVLEVKLAQESQSGMDVPRLALKEDSPAPEGWVADLHKEILTMASRPVRNGTNAGNPRKHTMTDGQFIYLPLHDDDTAKTPAARRHALNYRDIHQMRKPENAHPRITWLRGPNPTPRAGRKDAYRTQWVRVEITGPAERRISRAEAGAMFREV